MDVKAIAAIAFIAALFWLLRFFWVRILATSLALLAYTAVILYFPLLFIATRLDDGEIGGALMTLIVSILPWLLWWGAVIHWRQWIDRKRRLGAFSKPLFATD